MLKRKIKPKVRVKQKPRKAEKTKQNKNHTGDLKALESNQASEDIRDWDPRGKKNT